MIHPAEKEITTAVMNKEEYNTNVKNILADERTYGKLCKDPILEHKDKLVKILETLLEKITSGQNYKLVPVREDENVPHMYNTPKIHKQFNPLCPIVDCTCSIVYKISRCLADPLAL